jgi:3',5'-cyclic AMP phosphodiesterase CpdA
MTFSFVQITDHHLSTSEDALVRGFSPAYAFRAVLRHIAENVADTIDFIFSTGDLVEPDSQSTYRSLSRMLGLSGEVGPPPGPRHASIEGLREFPMYFMPGNHDDRRYFFENLFPQTPPMPLMNVAFTHKGVQFICLDWGTHAKAVAYPETLEFLEASLQNGTPSIVVTHHHVTPVGSRWLDDFIADGIERFWEIVRGCNVIGILCAHTHLTYEKVVEGIPVYGIRSTAFPFALQDEPLVCLMPPQYRYITVQDNLLTTRVFEVPL